MCFGPHQPVHKVDYWWAPGTIQGTGIEPGLGKLAPPHSSLITPVRGWADSPRPAADIPQNLSPHQTPGQAFISTCSFVHPALGVGVVTHQPLLTKRMLNPSLSESHPVSSSSRPRTAPAPQEKVPPSLASSPAPGTSLSVCPCLHNSTPQKYKPTRPSQPHSQVSHT